MPGLPGVAGDALEIIRKRPAVAVGAGVAVLVAVRLLNRDTGDAAPAEDAAATDGSSLLGGGLGSISYPGLPTNGDLQDSGVVTTPPATPTPPTTPKPTTSYLFASVKAGTYTLYANQSGRAVIAGSLKTGGFSGECSALTLKQTDGTGSVAMIVMTTGAHAGKMLRRASAGITVTTRTR